MSTKPKTTFYSLSTTEAVETAWKLKRLTETHEMLQRKLVKEYRAKSAALTNEMQAKQSAVFDSMRDLMGIPGTDWGDGKSWALNIENLADGTVALVHDEDLSHQKDDCNCPICQLCRVITGTKHEDEVKPVIH